MSKKKMWFGPRGFETWVPSPQINPDYTRVGWSSGEQQYLSGEVGLRESKNAHNAYVLSWGATNSRDDMRLITDFADGVFDTQDGLNLIYWIDPMAREKNILTQAMATPHLATEDAPPLITKADGTGRPTSVLTPTNAYRYPARGALYEQLPTSRLYSQYIPIPPGRSLWLGVHADTEGIMHVQRVRGWEEVGDPIVLDTLGLVSRQVNTEITSQQAGGVVLSFVPTSTSRTFTLYGLVAQVLRTGESPVATNFISGQGHSGCQFVGKPARTPYSAFYDRVALTARLIEVGMAQ